jgi:hypothetical protein
MVMVGEPALAADSWIGTWELNVSKSSYSSGPAPVAETVTTSDIGDGKLNTIIDVKEQDGKATHFEITYANDGADYPIGGSAPGKTASSRYVNAQTLESRLKIDGKAVTTTTEVMAADSMSFISTTIATTRNGTPIKNVQVYERI